MKRGWGIVGGCLGLAAGIAAGPTLFADEASGKDPGIAVYEVLPLQTGVNTTDTKFVEIEPARAFDSRQPGYTGRGLFQPNSSKMIFIGNGHDAGGAVTRPDIVPAGATAIAYNITVTGATGPNFVAVTPGNVGSFTTSAINFNGTADVANAGIVSIDDARQIRVWNGDQLGSTHVIIDITGYFVRPLYAQVNPQGTLRNGSRVVSVTRVKAGHYEVKFDRNVLNCAKVATLGQWFGLQDSGVIDFQTVDSEPETVRVYTQENDGVNQLVDRAFNVAVTC
jgi:hypothetical protein